MRPLSSCVVSAPKVCTEFARAFAHWRARGGLRQTAHKLELALGNGEDVSMAQDGLDAQLLVVEQRGIGARVVAGEKA